MPQRRRSFQSLASCQVRRLWLPCRLSRLLRLCLTSQHMLLAPLHLCMQPLALPQLLLQLRLAVQKLAALVLLPLLSLARLLLAREQPQCLLLAAGKLLG